MMWSWTQQRGAGEGHDRGLLQVFVHTRTYKQTHTLFTVSNRLMNIQTKKD